MLFGITMFVNVWGVIWRNQKVVIANARNVIAGGEADPNAAAAGRKAALASRQNTVFSFVMLFFMIGAVHFFPSYNVSSDRGIYWAITLVVFLVLELNCLGVIGGTGHEHHELDLREPHARDRRRPRARRVLVRALGDHLLIQRSRSLYTPRPAPAGRCRVRPRTVLFRSRAGRRCGRGGRRRCRGAGHPSSRGARRCACRAPT